MINQSQTTMKRNSPEYDRSAGGRTAIDKDLMKSTIRAYQCGRPWRWRQRARELRHYISLLRERQLCTGRWHQIDGEGRELIQIIWSRKQFESFPLAPTGLLVEEGERILKYINDRLGHYAVCNSTLTCSSNDDIYCLW